MPSTRMITISLSPATGAAPPPALADPRATARTHHRSAKAQSVPRRHRKAKDFRPSARSGQPVGPRTGTGPLRTQAGGWGEGDDARGGERGEARDPVRPRAARGRSGEPQRGVRQRKSGGGGLRADVNGPDPGIGTE